MMPGTDGLDLGPVLRAMPGLAATRYVLSSSSGMFNSHNSARKHGFDAALPKPLRPGALIRCIEGLSSQPAAAASPVAVPSTASPVTTIPSSVKPPAAETSPVVPLSPASASTPRTSQIRILLAEDNATNQKLAIALLKRENYAIDVAGNGLEALEALHNLPYDLVLMDVQMPELDGMEASRKIRDSNASYASVPIIGITAHAMKGDRERVLESGMNDYLTKPIDKTELLEKVALWTRKKAQGNDVPPAAQSRSA
jgi:CheY-like chemotaxis protein